MKNSKDLLENSSQRSSKLSIGEKRLGEIMDSLLEDFQILDFDWRYIYEKKTTRKMLLGNSIIERYPDIKKVEFFSVLEQCMLDRNKKQIETEFVCPDQSKKLFDLRIEPVEEGILIVSLDITKQKEADEKIERANHLYSFISQVNQNIVRVKDEATLFRNACRMALEFGKFKMAWIGKLDNDNKKITLIDHSGIPIDEIKLFSDVPFQATGAQDYVMRTGTYYICNDIEHDPELEYWKPYALRNGIRSCMVLPIRKSSHIIVTFNLYSTELNFMAQEEINLLVEVASDISFALDLFEKEKKHAATAELLVKNEKQFRHTLDNMLEGIQIHDFNWRYIYVNNSLVNYSTYSREELLGFTMMEKYPGIEETPLFKVMQKCMTTRKADQLETDFIFPNGEKAYFELSIQPIPEGIFILSVDRSEQKKAKEKLLKVNRLYAFISAINQSIVHISNEQSLLNNACNIAVDIGKFNLARVDQLDAQRGELNMVSIRGNQEIVRAAQLHSTIDCNTPAFRETMMGLVLDTGCYAVSNSLVSQDKGNIIGGGIKASISLPIKKATKVVGIFSLQSTIEGFFDEEEISLLEEATGDISFALENYEKAEKHRLTEELVVKNEIRFRALIEKSADMITLVNAEGELLYGSPSVTKVLGYTLEELLHKPDYEFIHPDDIPSFVKHTASLLKTPGESFNNQQRLLHKDGSWVWCEGTVTNMLHQPGVHAIVSNFRDITEKKSLEQQRDFNKNNLKALINNTTDLMWSVDKNFNLITSNQPFDEMIKSISGGIIVKGSNILHGGHPQDRSSHFKSLYERAFTGEAFTQIEYKDFPVETWFEISYYPILRENEVIGTACHSRDISEIKRAEHKLKKSESFNRGILNSLSSQIAVVNSLGNIVAINESWRRFAEEYGSTVLQGTGVGNNYFNVCETSALAGDDTASFVLSGMKDVLDEKIDVFYFEYPCHSHNKQRWFSMRVMKFDSLEPMIVVSHEDISDRKQAEEKLIFNNEELQKTNAELDRFVYSASHDLRAPLCSVLGLVSLLEIESKETNTLEYAKMIRNSINRLDGFIKNILNYSKNNRLELEANHVPLRKTIDNIINSLRNMKEADGVAFEVNIEEQHGFYSDIHRFTIIIENLLSNALKFQDYSKSNRFIKITGKSDTEGVNLQIADNGIGIAQEYQHKIFDMFFRISGEREGSGIGLYIVKETIIKLHGLIKVDSREHEGTNFYIYLRNLIP